MAKNPPWTYEDPATPNRHNPNSDTAAVITIAADDDEFWILDHLIYSYNLVPTAGRLTVAVGANTLLDIDISLAECKQLIFPPYGLHSIGCVKGEAMVITLAAGGTGVSGSLFASTR